MLTTLKMIRHTLNTIEVKGKENMSCLLGCIDALDNIIQRAEQLEGRPAEAKKETADG